MERNIAQMRRLIKTYTTQQVLIVGVLVAVALGTSAQEQKTLPAGAATPALTAQHRGANAVGSETISSSGNIPALFVDLMAARGFKKTSAGGINRPLSRIAPSVESWATVVSTDSNDDDSGLPLWTYKLVSSRDGQNYRGAMVGRNPFKDPGPAEVPTEVIPLIITTQNVAVSFDPNTGTITTMPGITTADPTAPDNVCLASPNDVPLKLVSQSPIFTPASFTFGGTFVGKTQYSDAFQRANFWNVLGEDRDQYHVRLKLRVLDPVVINVPSAYGLSITNPLFLGPPAFCAPLTIVGIDWFDNYLTGTLIPALAAQGVKPDNLPIFLVYNVGWGQPATNLYTCCALGYHSITGFPALNQTYSASMFNTTGVFSTSTGDTGPYSDTAILSHEVDEWMDDPLTVNPTPLWGHTGQQGGCQGNLEVGDPLTGTAIPSVTMPNGFTYHLQELAFFSWFYGAPSIGVNGWFSNNGTFTTDAGAPCY